MDALVECWCCLHRQHGSFGPPTGGGIQSPGNPAGENWQGAATQLISKMLFLHNLLVILVGFFLSNKLKSLHMAPLKKQFKELKCSQVF